ncbi:MAG TPA: methionine adenosyltransferase [Polyangiaceae bacterium]|nr:methionine adenosyltransferase [Polyangiaceae bacterium]
MTLVVRPLASSVEQGEVEIVEHKGIGHPDTMCDGLAEAFGGALARHYAERFGSVLHFNVDKALLVGGASRPELGAGQVLEPMRVLLAGRATREVRGARVPVDDIAHDSARAWIREHMHALDPERHVRWECSVRSGSSDLVDLFLARRGRGAWLANDTSVGAGYAPLSALERAVQAAAVELRRLAGIDPAIGEDVKVMGVRRGRAARLTVACALVCGPLADLGAYVDRRAAVGRAVAVAASEATAGQLGIEAVDVNAADDLASGRIYLTVTGTSAESGDDGEVGRGNRANGLITPYRPMSLEAIAGKNPVSHVGRLYNFAAQRIASSLVQTAVQVQEAHCFIQGCIGRPVGDPALVDVGLRTDGGAPIERRLRARVQEVVDAELSHLSNPLSERPTGAMAGPRAR